MQLPRSNDNASSGRSEGSGATPVTDWPTTTAIPFESTEGMLTSSAFATAAWDDLVARSAHALQSRAGAPVKD
jgi:hypothetical protein